MGGEGLPTTADAVILGPLTADGVAQAAALAARASHRRHMGGSRHDAGPPSGAVSAIERAASTLDDFVGRALPRSCGGRPPSRPPLDLARPYTGPPPAFKIVELKLSPGGGVAMHLVGDYVTFSTPPSLVEALGRSSRDVDRAGELELAANLNGQFDVCAHMLDRLLVLGCTKPRVVHLTPEIVSSHRAAFADRPLARGSVTRLGRGGVLLAAALSRLGRHEEDVTLVRPA